MDKPQLIAEFKSIVTKEEFMKKTLDRFKIDFLFVLGVGGGVILGRNTSHNLNVWFLFGNFAIAFFAVGAITYIVSYLQWKKQSKTLIPTIKVRFIEEENVKMVDAELVTVQPEPNEEGKD